MKYVMMVFRQPQYYRTGSKRSRIGP